jgi:hypothetical protein
MPTKRIFLSYAGEDAAWKDNFISPTWFGSLLGPVEMEDYRDGGGTPFGSIRTWLTSEIDGSAAFLAFVSKNYIDKEYPLSEWAAALSKLENERVVFVPVMLDGTAKTWWAEQKRGGGLRDLGDDYAYADFTDGRGNPAKIVTEFGPIDGVTRKIGELARLIKEHLHREEPAPEPISNRKSIVILGHPTAISSEDITKDVNELVNLLTCSTVFWNDRWRSTKAARKGSAKSLLESESVFLQPLEPGDAADMAEDPGRFQKWLTNILGIEVVGAQTLLESCKKVLWCPQGRADESFANAVRASSNTTDIILRSDSPSGLAAYLLTEICGDTRTEVPILTLEEVQDVDETKLRDALHTGFCSVVDDVVRPTPERWYFHSEILVDLVRNIPGDRAIIAVHDLNTGIAQNQREARAQLERKLGAIASDVQGAIRAAGRTDLKVFWSALLVQKADQLPWVKYPAPSEFENWCCLPFARPNVATEDSPVVEPRAAHKNVFRNYLRDWASL